MIYVSVFSLLLAITPVVNFFKVIKSHQRLSNSIVTMMQINIASSCSSALKGVLGLYYDSVYNNTPSSVDPAYLTIINKAEVIFKLALDPRDNATRQQLNSKILCQNMPSDIP